MLTVLYTKVELFLFHHISRITSGARVRDAKREMRRGAVQAKVVPWLCRLSKLNASKHPQPAVGGAVISVIRLVSYL